MQSPMAEGGQYSGSRAAIALVSPASLPHIPIMHSDFSLFRERLAYACRARGITPDRLCVSIGLGSRRRVDLAFSGLKALDIYRLAQIADRLEVSVDWLLGRSDVMELSHGKNSKRA